MRITIEVDSKREMDKLSAFLKTFNVNTIKVLTAGDPSANIKKGNKKIDPSDLFGMWANEPRSAEEIRRVAWQRKSGE
jgi:hypothetical protein